MPVATDTEIAPPVTVQDVTRVNAPASAQLEGMGDVNIDSFKLELANKTGIQLTTAITEAVINRTIEGASTLTVKVDDDLTRTIQNSGKLGRHVTVVVDGLKFALVAVSKNGRELSLTFEDYQINLLRYYDTWKQWERSKFTRAEVIKWMIEEVAEEALQWVIPELHVLQEPSPGFLPGERILDSSGNPVNTAANTVRAPGIPIVTTLTVKSQAATEEQIRNANTILSVGNALGARRKVLVVAIMTAITESTIHNYPGQDQGSYSINNGVFQQDSRYWPASGDVAIDAAEFIRRAMANDVKNPNLSYNDLAQATQNSGVPNAYGPHQAEAEEWVTAFGTAPEEGSPSTPTPPAVVGTAGDPNVNPAISKLYGEPYRYWRGDISKNSQGQVVLKPENSWDAMKRLAQEVQWRVFCVSGVIYYLSDAYLFRSKPFMVIDEDTDGIDWIDYDYDEGKRSATVRITCHISRWSAPPGSIVQIINMGLVNGRWIVNDVERSLFSTLGSITLKKPLPTLPEPSEKSQQNQFGGGIVTGPPATVGDPSAPPATVVPPGPIAAQVIAYAYAQLGKPYEWAAAGPGTFDCSGLTMAAYSSVIPRGISLPHNAQGQYDQGPKVSIVDTLQPGDLVFFDGDNRPPQADAISHCGIYIGGGKMIAAPHTGDVVKISDITTGYYKDGYIGATRPWAQPA